MLEYSFEPLSKEKELAAPFDDERNRIINPSRILFPTEQGKVCEFR